MDLRSQYQAHGTRENGSPSKGEGRYGTEGGILAPPPTSARGSQNDEPQNDCHRPNQAPPPNANTERLQKLAEDVGTDGFSRIEDKIDEILARMSNIEAVSVAAPQVSQEAGYDEEPFLSPEEQKNYIDERVAEQIAQLEEEVRASRAEADELREHEIVQQNNTEAAEETAKELETLREELAYQKSCRSTAEHECNVYKKNLAAAERQRDEALHEIKELEAAQRQDLEMQMEHAYAWEDQVKEAQKARDEIEDMMQYQLEDERARTQRVEERRRALFEQVQELKGSIRVFCRIRPAPSDTPAEELLDFGEPEPGEFGEEWGRLNLSTIRKAARGDVAEVRSFDFERVFGQDATNEDIFNQITDLTQSAMEGKKVCIFCYGQTGSGKTHTMLGTEEAPGLIPQTISMLFETAAEQELDYIYTIELSITEIYQDTIHDLLQPPVAGKKVSVRMTEAMQVVADSTQDAIDMLNQASKYRTVAATNANEQSSRSHLVLALRITRDPHPSTTGGQTTVGTLNLIDLAGSERAAAAGAKGTQMREGISINSDLMNLNRVITALGSGTRVPYDSALTKTLRDSLTQGSRTLMFVMVSPFRKDQSQTVQSLEKGAEATKAKLTSITRAARRPASGTPAAATTPARAGGSAIPRSASQSSTSGGRVSTLRGTPQSATSGTPGASKTGSPRNTPGSSLCSPAPAASGRRRPSTSS